MTPCPPADHLQRFAAGTLAAPIAAAFERHVDTCPACRAALSSVARGQGATGRYGRYVVEGVLGVGGMGLLYRARDPELDRAVAIKVVRDLADAEQRARLLREARSLAQVSHRNVCQVHDVGVEGDEVWVAMELIDGATLRAWAHTAEPEDRRVALVDAARGLAAVHDAGLIHRDVKPDNILVEEGGRVVVCDFGLARGDEHTGTAPAVIGTPAYLAPEQLTGVGADARTDQFAWALTAWELLCDERPFAVEPAARLAMIQRGPGKRLAIDRDTTGILTRALAADPAARYPSMRDVIAAMTAPPLRPKRVAMIVAGIVCLLAITVPLAVWIADRSKDDVDEGPPLEAPIAAPPPAAPAPALVPDLDDDVPAGFARFGASSPLDRLAPEVEWRRAGELVVDRLPDATVIELTANGVGVDGTVDATRGGTVTAQWVSRGSLDRGALPCGVAMALQSTGGYLQDLTTGACSDRLAPWPRCAVAAVWQKAKLPAGSIASLRYGLDAHQRAVWTVTAGRRFVIVPDRC